jgi:hypothetical protein
MAVTSLESLGKTGDELTSFHLLRTEQGSGEVAPLYKQD